MQKSSSIRSLGPGILWARLEMWQAGYECAGQRGPGCGHWGARRDDCWAWERLVKAESSLHACFVWFLGERGSQLASAEGRGLYSTG